MATASRSFRLLRSEKGATMAVVVLILVVLLGAAALVLDLGVFFVTKNQLQNVSDGSALAGTRVLGNLYQGLTPAQQQTFTCNTDCENQIRTASKDVAADNAAADVGSVSLLDSDILIGQWSADVFTETLDQPDAVQVLARRDPNANLPVRTFFGRVLGIQNASISATATAALTGQGTVNEGDLTIPVTISKWFFENNACNDYIRFYPTNDPQSCGGWTTFYSSPSNNPTLEDYLDEILTTPGITVYDDDNPINMIGGTLTSVFPEMLSMFQRNGCATDNTAARNFLPDLGPTMDDCVDYNEVLTHPNRVAWEELNNKGLLEQGVYPDGTLRYYHKWETVVPVYDRDDCSNPNQSEVVVGFAPVEIVDVRGPPSAESPNQQITGRVICDLVSPDPNRGGGGEYGIKGSIPGLVK